MIIPITIIEMQRLNIACKRVLGAEEWERRFEVAWESLRNLEYVTADMLESAIMDGFGAAGVHFASKVATKTLGGHPRGLDMIFRALVIDGR